MRQYRPKSGIYINEQFDEQDCNYSFLFTFVVRDKVIRISIILFLNILVKLSLFVVPSTALPIFGSAAQELHHTFARGLMNCIDTENSLSMSML